MPYVKFNEDLLVFHHHIPRTVELTILSETQIFTVKFTVSDFPSSYILDSNGNHVESLELQHSSLILAQQALYYFPLTLGGPVAPPAGIVLPPGAPLVSPGMLTVIVRNSNNESSYPDTCEIEIHNP